MVCCSMDKLIGLASKMAVSDTVREIKRRYGYVSLNEMKCRHLLRSWFVKALWCKLNLLTERAFRGRCTPCRSLDSMWDHLRENLPGNAKLKRMKDWVFVKLFKNQYWLSTAEGQLSVTCSTMGTFPVKVPADQVLKMIQTYDCYLADNDIEALLDASLCAYRADLRATELLTMTFTSLVEDLIETDNIVIKVWQSCSGKVLCKIKDTDFWRKEYTFITSIQTFREDFILACIKAEIEINLKPVTMKYIEQVSDKNPVYKLFTGVDFLKDVNVRPTIWNGKLSQRSLMFEDELDEVFQVDDFAFVNHFSKVVSGAGHEGLKIRTMHSSSLLSFLCFFGVSEDHPLYLTIEGDMVKFTGVVFEFTPGVVGTDERGEDHRSNIDIYLVSDDGSVALLLESKFTEYLSWGKQTGISEYVYGDYYRAITPVMDELGLEYVPEAGKMSLKASTGATRVYAQGLKQMLSHTLSARDFAKEDKTVKVYLASIVYKFPERIDNGKFEAYVKAHQTWCRGLNELPVLPSNLKALETPFVYQDVFSGINAGILPERVKEYYGFV